MSRTDRVLFVMLTLGFVTGVTVAIATGAFADRPQLPANAPADAPVEASPAPATAAPTTQDSARRTPVVEAVERVAPAVVAITTEGTQYLFGRIPQTQSESGSGVVIDRSGVVLTNAHVVSSADRITATFADGRSYRAEILGMERDLDLAVLRLQGASELTAVEIGTSAELMLGEPVIAIGNPFGLGHTVTTGVVSSTQRSVTTSSRVSQDFIQTDASINPGNSGGPLLDVRGRLIGINTMIYNGGEGIGFAIPSDRAMKIATDLLQFGGVVAPWLGCDLVDVNVREAGQVRSAAQVVRAHAGPLREGDVLMSIDRRTVRGRADLNAYLASFQPGRDVELQVLRDGVQQRVTVTAVALPDAVVQRSLSEVLGVEVAALSPEQAARARAGGVAVTRVNPNGSFAGATLRAGDLITAFNGEPVTSPEQLRQLVARAKSGHRPEALLSIQRGNQSGRIPLEI